MPTPPGARRASKAAARPKAASTKKVAGSAGSGGRPKRVQLETDQQLIRRLEAAGASDADIGRAIREGAHQPVTPSRPARRSTPIQINSEDQILRNASQQSAARRSTAAPSTRRVAPSAGSSGGKKPGPLVRAGNGSLNLRGGTRRNWKRDMLGRFA